MEEKKKNNNFCLPSQSFVSSRKDFFGVVNAETGLFCEMERAVGHKPRPLPPQKILSYLPVGALTVIGRASGVE